MDFTILIKILSFAELAKINANEKRINNTSEMDCFENYFERYLIIITSKAV